MLFNVRFFEFIEYTRLVSVFVNVCLSVSLNVKNNMVTFNVSPFQICINVNSDTHQNVL